MPRNPRPHKVYGYSPVEQIVLTVNVALRRALSQLQYYTEGNVPEALIVVPPTGMPGGVPTPSEPEILPEPLPILVE